MLKGRRENGESMTGKAIAVRFYLYGEDLWKLDTIMEMLSLKNRSVTVRYLIREKFEELRRKDNLKDVKM